MGFNDARAYCGMQGGDIATPDNILMNDFFMSLINDFTPVHRYWIGVDASTGRWIRDDGLDLEWEFWATGKGNAGDVALATSTDLDYPGGPWDGQWEDFVDDGSLLAHVICRKLASKK